MNFDHIANKKKYIYKKRIENKKKFFSPKICFLIIVCCKPAYLLGLNGVADRLVNFKSLFLPILRANFPHYDVVNH